MNNIPKIPIQGFKGDITTVQRGKFQAEEVTTKGGKVRGTVHPDEMLRPVDTIGVKVRNEGAGVFSLEITKLPIGQEKKAIDVIKKAAEGLGFKAEETSIDKKAGTANLKGIRYAARIEDLTADFKGALAKELSDKGLLLTTGKGKTRDEYLLNFACK